MDTTPDRDLVSEIAEADPADAVEPAEALADELEASLVAEDAEGAVDAKGEASEPSPS